MASKASTKVTAPAVATLYVYADERRTGYVSLADRIAVANAGVALGTGKVWPIAAPDYGRDTEANTRRARNRAEADAAATAMHGNIADALISGALTLHVFVGPNVRMANVSEPVVTDDGSVKRDKDGAVVTRVASYGNVSAPFALADVCRAASAVFVSAGSDDPRDYSE